MSNVCNVGFAEEIATEKQPIDFPEMSAPATDRQRRYVSKDAVIVSGPHRHDIDIGVGCVIHPFAEIDATKGPISIGEYCIIDEGAVIVNEVSSRDNPTRRMTIGDGNHFGPRCNIRCARIGANNVFLAGSSAGVMSVVEDDCVFHAKARVTHDALVPKATAVTTDGRWLSREHVDAAEARDRVVKLSRHFRSANF